MKLYKFVVHYLQMCMKEYGCCTKFKRGDNSTSTFTKRGRGHVPCNPYINPSIPKVPHIPWGLHLYKL
jgi:hypothetical protein